MNRYLRPLGLLCIALGISSASFSQTIPTGKGAWIDYPADAMASMSQYLPSPIYNYAQLAAVLKNPAQGNCSWVALKCVGGTETVPEFVNSGVVAECKAAGLKVYGWALVTGQTDPALEATNARAVIENAKADGLIIVPYVSKYASELFYEKPDQVYKDYWNALIGKQRPTFAIGYSTDSLLDTKYKNKDGKDSNSKPANDYFMKQDEVDFYMPRAYWRKMTPDRYSQELQWVEANWLNPKSPAKPKPVIVIGQCQNRYGNYGVITQFRNAVSNLQKTYPNLKGYSLFKLDLFYQGDYNAWIQ